MALRFVFFLNSLNWLWEARGGMRRGGRQGVLVLCSVAVGLSRGVCPPPAVAEANGRQPIRDMQVTDLFVPPELGEVLQVHQRSNADPATKLLIVIQDAHVNYDAQKHLAQILDRLVSAHGIRLILVEGGEGDVSLSYLRRRGSKAARHQVAEEYLQAGVLSGEEYLEIVSDHPLILWGVDDPARYAAHLEAFLEVERMREAVGQGLGQLRQAVERLRALMPNEALRAFEVTQASFEAGQLPFDQYLDALRRESERVGVALSDSPNLWRVVTASQLEETMETEQVAAEQRQVVDRLRHQLAEEPLTSLTAIADRVKAGQADPAAFYQQLDALIQAAGIDLAPFPHLAQYLRYMRVKAELQPRELWSELGQLQRQITARLLRSPEEAELVSTVDRLARCERLITLAWTPDDYQRYREQPDQVRTSRWLPALRAQAQRLGVTFDWQGNSTPLDEQLANAARFYDIAQSRDAEIIRRTLEKMEAEGQRLAVLIAGGFHTDNLVRQLAEQPVHVAVVTPVTGQQDDDARYAEILKAKARHRMPSLVGAHALGTPSAARTDDHQRAGGGG